MKTGDTVWNQYHGILRLGTIQSKTMKNGWAYFTVDWHCDEAYERAMKHREELCHENYYLEEYRADQIKTISSERLRNIVKHLNIGENHV